jgi:hypothetical protein
MGGLDMGWRLREGRLKACAALTPSFQGEMYGFKANKNALVGMKMFIQRAFLFDGGRFNGTKSLL